MRALLFLALLTSTAHADFNVDRVLDPSNLVSTTTVTDAINALDVNCGVKDTMLVWIVFEGGKVTNVDAGGTGDRKIERCIATGLRKAKIAAKQRAVAVVTVAATIPKKIDMYARPVRSDDAKPPASKIR